MNLSRDLISKVKTLYEDAKIVYADCAKPANYIPGWIKRRIEENLSTEDIYCIINNRRERPKCIVCGKDCEFINLFKGYRKTCRGVCARQTEEYKETIRIANTGRKNPLKGKTYKEIYGNREVRCGFQKGENNVAKRPEIRYKISQGIKKSYEKNNGELRKKRSAQSIKNNSKNIIAGTYKKYPAKDGNLYRSNLEVKLANLLLENNIPFKYEVPIKMHNEHFKIVDFVIDDSLFIEVSGYAYESWKEDFDRKMQIFDESRDIDHSIILILTYPDKLYEMNNRHRFFKHNCVNLFYDSIDNERHFLRGIKFYRSLLNYNKLLTESKICI